MSEAVSWDDETVTEVLRLYCEEGWSKRAVSRHLGISRRQVDRIITEAAAEDEHEDYGEDEDIARQILDEPYTPPTPPIFWAGVARGDGIKTRDGAVNLAGAQRDRGVQGLGGLGVGGMGQAAAVSPVTSLQTANRRVISVR